MDGALPIIFLGVVLKVPVFFGIWLVWWASRQYDEFADETPPESEDHRFRRFRREPRRPPNGPRRGPHGGGAAVVPDCPPGGRTRTATARAGSRERSHERQRVTAAPRRP